MPRFACLGLALAIVVLTASVTTSLADPTPAPIGSTGSLAAELDPLIQDAAGRYGVLIEAQASGARYEHHADAVFRSASVYKLPLAVEVLRKLDRHELGLDDQLSIGSHRRWARCRDLGGGHDRPARPPATWPALEREQ